MSQGWMVRSGRGGAYVEEFLKHNVIAIGWNNLEVDLSILSQDVDASPHIRLCVKVSHRTE